MKKPALRRLFLCKGVTDVTLVTAAAAGVGSAYRPGVGRKGNTMKGFSGAAGVAVLGGLIALCGPVEARA